MTVSLIAAMSENRVIGRENGLPWKLPDDLKRLKRLTMGHHVIMGRKTFDSIHKALPGRINVVITRNLSFEANDVARASSLEDALRLAEASGDPEVFVAGGGEIFEQALPLADRIYLTLIHKHFDGDTFFPDFDRSVWTLATKEERLTDEKSGLPYSFLTYEKIMSDE